MATSDSTINFKDYAGTSKATRARHDTTGAGGAGDDIPGATLYGADGVAISASAPLPVSIISDAAGSDVATDDESIPRGDTKAALAAAILYGANGVAVASGDRIIAYVFSGAQAVQEVGAKGTATATTVTVDATTTNGVELIAANSSGTRRRVIITQRGSVAVEIAPGNITAATGKGRYLPGIPGAEQTWFIQGTLRATVAAGTQEVSVSTEILA